MMRAMEQSLLPFHVGISKATNQVESSYLNGMIINEDMSG